jgi:hypothetical protein
MKSNTVYDMIGLTIADHEGSPGVNAFSSKFDWSWMDMAAEVRGMILARSVVDERLQGSFDPRLPFEAFRGRVLPG